jgi:competence protein ComEC
MGDQRPPVPLLLAIGAVAILAIIHSEAIRSRASAALGRGAPAREAALARGFVLGEDDEVDPGTSEDFRRSGLSHLLAVSGQNVALLALLANPLLAALGIPLRTRLLWLLALIAAYVPIAGAAPSIQRAAVMGALSVIAMLAGRRRTRFYPLAVAAAVTLAVEPGVAADVGWQMSFAAVLGILLLGPMLRESQRPWLGDGAGGRALREAVAMTVAATLATAPLIAFHFGELSTTTLLANLLAAPAVAPAMWLGMVAAAAGQLPGFPVEVINGLDALFLAYIAQVAGWCGRPSWALVHLHLSLAGLTAAYLGLAAGVLLALRMRRRRRTTVPRTRPPAAALRIAAALLAVLASIWGLSGPSRAEQRAVSPGGLRISVLDVGQGDAILLQPGAAPPVLVDGGPPGDGLAAKLRDAGVEALGAVVVTHDQRDHAGGVREILGGVPIGHLEYAALRPGTLRTVRAAGVATERIASGDRLRSGGLRLDVLWPPPEMLAGRAVPEDPNSLSLVLLARWRGFTMLLTGDAESATTPLDPGPLDALKVAHHGSEDPGLAELLAESSPRIAIVSVGADNPYGHPAPSTLATLARNGVRVMRTDRDGTVVLEVGRASMVVRAGS